MLKSPNARAASEIICYWSRTQETEKNFGDALNPLLLKALTGKPVEHYNDCGQWRKLFSPMLFCIGSILDRNKLSHRLRPGEIHVWGTGTRGEKNLAHFKKATIHAVRGPLTRKKLLEDGVACPEIYGDPAILLPQIIKPSEVPSPSVCLMPHYADVARCSNWLSENGLTEQVHVIDVMAPITQVVHEISSAKCVVSSSLHGLIVADAYGVPNARIRFGDAIAGGDFKYHDYFLSVDRPLSAPIDGNGRATVESLLERCELGNAELIGGVGRALPDFCR